MTRSFRRVPNLAVEDLEVCWAVYSPLSGGTHLLNDTSAAMLLALPDGQAVSSDTVSKQLADEAGIDVGQAQALTQDHWSELVGAGLVREQLAA